MPAEPKTPADRADCTTRASRPSAKNSGSPSPKIPRSAGRSPTSPTATADSYRHAIDALDAAIVAYRLTDIAGAGKTKTNNGVVAVCGCGRKLRVSSSMFEVGPIVCGVRNAEFEAEDDEG